MCVLKVSKSGGLVANILVAVGQDMRPARIWHTVNKLNMCNCSNMFPRTCAGIAIESRVGDIADDTHEVRIEGGPLIFQLKNYIQVCYSGG